MKTTPEYLMQTIICLHRMSVKLPYTNNVDLTEYSLYI